MVKPLLLSVLQDENLLAAAVEYATLNTSNFMDFLQDEHPELYEKYTQQLRGGSDDKGNH